MCTSQVLYQIEVPWDTYLPSGILGDRELQLVRRYDKAAKETQAQLLQVRGGGGCRSVCVCVCMYVGR